MIFLDELFLLKINKNMTFKSLNLLDTDEEYYLEIKKRTFNRIQIMEVPDILKCISTILDQFYFVFYPLDSLINKVAFYFFKKKMGSRN